MKRLSTRLVFLVCALCLSLLLASCGGGGGGGGGGGTLTVNSNNDVNDGTCDIAHCSLREAINKANTLGGTVNINFDIPGAGVQTIQPTSPLPTATVAVFIDGQSQPGFPFTQGIELDGSLAGAGADGLVIAGGNSTVRGLIINRFDGYGIRLALTGEDNMVANNFIGTDSTGSLAEPNHAGGVLIAGNNNRIGGESSHARNVISGNGGDGVVVNGLRNEIQANFIGVNDPGAAALPNQGNGVTLNANLNLVGGTDAGMRNIISGNADDGVHVLSGSILIQGNYIGTDVTGMLDLGNQANGVKVFGIDSVQIGGSEPGAGNVISGNQLFGIWLDDSSSDASVYHNYIGTDRTGNGAMPNVKGGVRMGGTNHQIGAAFEGGRNIISGNMGPGIAVLSTSTGGKIQNNYIGTTLDGKTAKGNGAGIEVGIGAGDTNVLIGGDPWSQGNLISGNAGEGVLLFRGATVQGNKIGTDDTGLAALPNMGNGILVKGPGNYIGGLGFFNIVAFNNKHGVAVISESGGATGNIISTNSIHDNDMLGIAIAEQIVIPNDSQDPDTGDNNRQNYPVIASVVTDPVAIQTVIHATLNSTPGGVFTVEFFKNASCDPSGYGEGHQMIKIITVTADVSGNALLNVVFPSTVFDLGVYVTATATDAGGNTSGFSNCVQTTEASAATPTPTPAAFLYKPFFDVPEFFWGNCTPNKVRIGAEVLDPPKELDYLLLFVKLVDKGTGEGTGWSKGMYMDKLGGNKYAYTVPLDMIPDYDKYTDAWLRYQFVAFNKAQERIGESEVFADVSFGRCGSAAAGRFTPTPKPAGVR
jgi:CSLREA domain-containing protein